LIATIFLSVLVLALVLGNVFLSLASPKRLQSLSQGSDFGQPEQCQPEQETESGQASVQDSFSEARDQPLPRPDFKNTAEKERVNHLNKRIERLEELLLKINNSKFLAQKLNGTKLSQRINEFDSFKQNTKLEIAALRQRLDKVQPQKKKFKQPVPDISNEKLKQLVFRSTR